MRSDHSVPHGEPRSDEPRPPARSERPTRRGRNRILYLLLAAVLLIAAALILLRVVPSGPPSPPSTPDQPNITITSFVAVDMRPTVCSGGGPVDFTLTLTNTGAPGYATVAFRVDATVLATQAYFVGRNVELPAHRILTVADCAAHSLSVGILNQTAA